MTILERGLTGEDVVGHGPTKASYLDVMSAFVGGVGVVTTRDDQGEPRGLTSTAIAGVSAEPPMLLVCVDKSSRTLPAFRERGAFVVNLLASGHESVSTLFASKAEDKFATLDWTTSPLNLPLLPRAALCWLECEVASLIEAGDHWIMLGRVVHTGGGDTPSDPLLYGNRRYGRVDFTAPAAENG